jgi:hypothetical protein
MSLGNVDFQISSIKPDKRCFFAILRDVDMPHVRRNSQAVVLGLFLFLSVVFPFARGIAAMNTPNFVMPTDVVPSGGGEKAKSTNYLLDDTIGEPNIGLSQTTNFALNAGYRQKEAEVPLTLSLTCSDMVTIPDIPGNGQFSGSGSCVVVSNSAGGYTLSWAVLTGSGGTNTGSLIAAGGHTVPPYTPSVDGTPETWSVAAEDAEWGGRLLSLSTDIDAKWGTDHVSDLWLNVPTTAYPLVTRGSATPPGGSTEYLAFRAEIGSNHLQVAGNYRAIVTTTAVSL